MEKRDILPKVLPLHVGSGKWYPSSSVTPLMGCDATSTAKASLEVYVHPPSNMYLEVQQWNTLKSTHIQYISLGRGYLYNQSVHPCWSTVSIDNLKSEKPVALIGKLVDWGFGFSSMIILILQIS